MGSAPYLFGNVLVHIVLLHSDVYVERKRGAINLSSQELITDRCICLQIDEIVCMTIMPL